MNSMKCDTKISSKTHVVFRQFLVLIFTVVTTLLFFYLNQVQPRYYIDEIFHIPQTVKFCDGNFHEWDPKITTFPGLYLIAVIILGPFNLCTISFLRGINLVGTFLNFYVIYELLKFLHKTPQKNVKKGKIDESKKWRELITSLNIALLPPLYFLLFLYYTDVISTNTVLLMYLFHLKGMFNISAFFGVLAVLFRQTNIVWVAWIALERGMDIIEKKNPNRIHKNFKNTPEYIRLLWENTKEELNRGRFVNLLFEMFHCLIPYILIGLIFILFVIWNKGIVLGDRSAHVATIHVPQVFYYSIFVGFFSWPYFLPYIRDYLILVKNRYLLSTLVFTIMGTIVHFNTLVHPYLLADNRHYTFYVWNKIMGRYHLAKYIFVPLYGFCFYSIYRGVNHLRFLSQINYFFITIMVLVPQLLLEPRYFFIPYIILKVNLRAARPWQIFAELITTLFIDGFQFFIFSNKVFYWDDDIHPQRISW